MLGLVLVQICLLDQLHEPMRHLLFFPFLIVGFLIGGLCGSKYILFAFVEPLVDCLVFVLDVHIFVKMIHDVQKSGFHCLVSPTVCHVVLNRLSFP